MHAPLLLAVRSLSGALTATTLLLVLVPLGACSGTSPREPLGGGGSFTSSALDGGSGGGRLGSGGSTPSSSSSDPTAVAPGAGEPCADTATACGTGLDCFKPAGTIDAPRCAPQCLMSANTGTANTCAEGTCTVIAGDRGACVVECDPFANTGCSGSLACEPATKFVASSASSGFAKFTGQCVAPGSKANGVACEGGDCGSGLTCAGIINNFGFANMACGPPCSSAHPCGTGFGCASLGLTGDALDYGTCQKPCTAVGADCATAGTWCAPSNWTAGLGVCVTPGTVASGAACVVSTQCQKGLACDLSDGRCHPVCTTIGAACSGGTCTVLDGTIYGVCR